jgi:hypothetical protein
VAVCKHGWQWLGVSRGTLVLRFALIAKYLIWLTILGYAADIPQGSAEQLRELRFSPDGQYLLVVLHHK